MTQDPEAAWPLTQTEPGYYPTTNPTPAPPSNVMPYTQAPYKAVHKPAGTAKPMSQGIRLAYLAIILGVSIPLTAISASMIGLLGVIICWVGIVMVTAIAFGIRR